MAFTKDAQREALLEAHNRFMRDNGLADLQLPSTTHGKPTVDPYHRSRQITGQPSDKQRKHRYAETWRASVKGTTGVGWIALPDGELAGDTMKVIASDGTVTYRNAHPRRQSVHAKQRAHATAQNTPKRITAADLAPIGNIE